MRTRVLNPVLRAFALLCAVALTAPAARAAINVNQDTFVLSDEAPGNLIARMVADGYGAYDLYDALVALQADTNPSVAGILTPAFFAALSASPASSAIFTTQLKDVPPGASVAIKTDGTVQFVGVHAWTYYNQPGTSTMVVDISGISGVEKGYFVHSTDPGAPLTSWAVDGPLPGMTTTYNVFAIGSGSVTRFTPVPAIGGCGLALFALLVAAAAAYVLRRQA